MKDLVRNPLGIVALFISLIYAFANLLLGMTISSLTESERYPIIIFIVLFPVVVLGVFYVLVSKHHGKLYAPGDYKDDKSFLRTLSPQERQERLELEVAEALPQPNLGSNSPAPTELHVESEQREMSATPHKAPLDLSRIYDDIRETEASALSYLERHYGPTEARDVAIQDTGVSFDALLKSGDPHIFAEIKFLRTPNLGIGTIDRLLYSAMVADNFFRGRFKLVLLVVYRFEKKELSRIEATWRKRIEKCPADIDLKFMHISEITG